HNISPAFHDRQIPNWFSVVLTHHSTRINLFLSLSLPECRLYQLRLRFASYSCPLPLLYPHCLFFSARVGIHLLACLHSLFHNSSCILLFSFISVNNRNCLRFSYSFSVCNNGSKFTEVFAALLFCCLMSRYTS